MSIGGQTDDGHTSLNDGAALFWNTRMDEAVQVFSRHATTPRGALHLAEIAVFRAALSEDKGDVSEGFRLLNEAESIANAEAKRGEAPSKLKFWASRDAPETPVDPLAVMTAKAAKAEVQFLTAILYLRCSQFLKGAFAIRRAWKAYEALAEEYEASTDRRVRDDADLVSVISMGLGFFYFFISLVPPKFLWVVEAIGFSADRDEGLAQLTRCFTSGGHRSPGALLLLVWMENFFLANLEESEALNVEALGFYPTSSLFLYLRGYLYRKTGHLDQAAADFTAASDAAGSLRQLQLAAMYESGWCLYLALDWEGAIELFEGFLAENRAPSFQAFCAYQLGYAYHMVGRTAEARKILATVRGRVRKNFTFDQYAARKAGEYLQGGLSDLERDLVVAELHCEARRFHEASQAVASLDEPRDPEDAVRFHYITGLAHKGAATQFESSAAEGADMTPANNMRTMAKASLNRAVALKDAVARETYIVPHALVELADLLIGEEDWRNAERNLEEAKRFSDYDFDKPLLRRLANLMDKIKNKGVSEDTTYAHRGVPRTHSSGLLLVPGASATAADGTAGGLGSEVDPSGGAGRSARGSGRASGGKGKRRRGRRHGKKDARRGGDDGEDDSWSFSSSAAGGAESGDHGVGGGAGPAAADLSSSSVWSDDGFETPPSELGDEANGMEVVVALQPLPSAVVVDRAIGAGDSSAAGSSEVSGSGRCRRRRRRRSGKAVSTSARSDGSSSMDSSAPAAHGAFEIDSDDKVGSGEDPDSEVDTATSMAETDYEDFTYVGASNPENVFGWDEEGKLDADALRALQAELDEIAVRMRDPLAGVEIKDRYYRLKKYHACFVGEEAVSWMVDSFGLTTDQALDLGQTLMNAQVLHHVTHSEAFKDGYFFYRFQEDIKTKVLNMRKIWVLPVNSPIEVVQTLTTCIFDALRKFLTPDGMRLDYAALGASREFRDFTLAAAELQNADVLHLPSNIRLAFFINLYNMMIIHGHIERGAPTNFFNRSGFFRDVKYRIGGHNFSLNDIEHGILRGNKAAYGSFRRQFKAADDRTRFVLPQCDPRMHFALNCGAVSCPPLRVFSFENIDGALDWAASEFIDSDVRVDLAARTVHLSKIFKWYYNDFADTDQGLIRYIIHYASGEMRHQLEALLTLRKFSIKYNPYDWKIMSTALEGETIDLG